MPLTGEGRNQACKAIGEGAASATHFAKYVSFGKTTSTLTLEAEAGAGKKFKAASKQTTGTLCVIKKLNASAVFGTALVGFVVGVPYWIREIDATHFGLAATKAQSEISEAECLEHTGTVEAGTELFLVAESEPKPKKRIATKFELTKNGEIKDTTGHEVEANETLTAAWAMYWAEEAFAAGELIAVESATSKALESGDIWKQTEATLNFNQFLP